MAQESNPPPSSALTPALFKRLHPKPYLERFLSERVRPDGRPLLGSPESGNGAVANQGGAGAWRDASANVGSISTAPSSALVRLGNTTLVCGITLEIATPDLATPNQGFLVPNIDLPPLCSSLFKPGPPSNQSQVMATKLRDILLASNVLPLSTLLIEPSKAAYVVYLDVVCLNYDGGILDAAVLACVGALRNLVLPNAEWNPDNGHTVCHPVSESHPGNRIPSGPLPLAVSFGIFNGHLLPDPTLFESDLCQTHITIALQSSSSPSDRDELLHVYQAGAPLGGTGAGDSKVVLRNCIRLARRRAKELREILES